MGIPEEFIEKDYFVSLLLKEIVTLNPNIVFKGGISLSKCYKLISRFSEDIDINFDNSIKSNNKEKKRLKDSIENAIDNVNLELTNGDEIKSRMDINRYKVDVRSVVGASGNLKEYLIVESYVSLKSFPSERMLVTHYILDFLEAEQQMQLIENFNIKSFEMNVQTVERTMIDKIFALCDYYEKGQVHQNSRHLYDIHKIWSNYQFERDTFIKLLNDVAMERSLKSKINVSAEKGYQILDKLHAIISNDV